MITFGYKSRFSGFTRGVVALILGTVMLFVGNAVDLMVYIIATFLLISGLLTLFVGLKKENASQKPLVMVNSGFNIVIAILMYIFASQLGNFVVGVIGFVMFLFGLLQIIVLGSANRTESMSKGFFAMPVLVLACGALLLFKPEFIGKFIGVVIGVSFILYGASELLSSWKMRSVIGQVESQPSQPSQPADEQEPVADVKDVDFEKVDEQ